LDRESKAGSFGRDEVINRSRGVFRRLVTKDYAAHSIEIVVDKKEENYQKNLDNQGLAALVGGSKSYKIGYVASEVEVSDFWIGGFGNRLMIREDGRKSREIVCKKY